METSAATAEATGTESALEWISLLASEVGPRRPTSRSEQLAAELVRDRLRAADVEAELEAFDGYPTFGAPFGLIAGMAAAPGLLPARLPRLRAALAAAAAGALALEGGLVHTPVSAALSRRPSQNLVATIEPRAMARRTLCLVSHLDSSRSGLIFHPALARYLNPWIAVNSLACLGLAGEGLLVRHRAGRRAAAVARWLLAMGLALLAERELRGEDVPGANDNASGVAIGAVLASECAARPLESTRVVLLMTGCEEAGLLGAQAFLRAHETSGWLFVNFDSVGGEATLRYARREGMVQKWSADPGLLAVAERIRSERPDLGLEPAEGPIGLTYDATAVMARGGRALTFVAGNGVIPNYHRPSDTLENVDPDALSRALEVGREMLAAIDRGEAD